MEKKMTQTEMYELIKTVCAEHDEIVAFCDAKIASLANKAEKARAKAAEKKAAGDELYAVVLDVLTAEPATCEDIVAKIEGEDITVAKVRARLSQAAKNGVVAKSTIKVDGKNKVVYALA